MTVRRLVQSRVAKPVTRLEDEELDHHDGVPVGASSLGFLVVVEALGDGSESFPIYVFLCLGRSVAQFLDVSVGYSGYAGSIMLLRDLLF